MIFEMKCLLKKGRLKNLKVKSKQNEMFEKRLSDFICNWTLLPNEILATALGDDMWLKSIETSVCRELQRADSDLMSVCFSIRYFCELCSVWTSEIL